MPRSSSCTRRRPPPGSRAPRTALVALGGYGRGALCPRSDIDIVLVHDGAEAAAVAALTQQLLYPLWDAGFSVGHAVRTPGESVELATERLDAATAMLDARLLAGDAGAAGRGLRSRPGPAPRRRRRVRGEPGERRPRPPDAVRFRRIPAGTGVEGGRRRPAGYPRVRVAPGGSRPAARGRRSAPDRRACATGGRGGVPHACPERHAPGERPRTRSACSGSSNTTSRRRWGSRTSRG